MEVAAETELAAYADVAAAGSNQRPARHVEVGYQPRAELHANGMLIYWHSPTINSDARRGSEPLLMEQSVTRALHQGLVVANFLYGRAGYVGTAEIALAVLDIAQASGASFARSFDSGPVYGAPAYRRHDRVTTIELRRDLEGIVRRLLAPLCDVISVRGYDAYAARDGRR